MIGYVCKYTPIEVFEFMGETCEKIEPELHSTPTADALFHPNMCTYSKAVLEACLSKTYHKIIFANCCDSIRRVYDILKYRFPKQFIYMMELPRKNTEEALIFYKDEIHKLILAYEAFTGRSFAFANFNQYLNQRFKEDQREDANEILLLGARTSKYLKENLQSRMNSFKDLTCSSHSQARPLKENSYEEGLLNQFPCMRMEKYWDDVSKVIDKSQFTGILYHTIKFCDFYSYGYALLKEKKHLKVLKLETDYMKQGTGQLLTRIEAFLESMKDSKSDLMKKNENDWVIGIDSGSTSTNIVLMNQEKKVIAYHILPTGAKSIQSAEQGYKELLSKAGLGADDVSYVVATGYGRVKIPFADECVTEISCHGKGASFFDSSVRTIIDIGGQDSKVIRINEKGDVLDFIMNDKCAAGTGRFLEMMSSTLEMSLDDMGDEHEKAREPLEISSMCTVFAESEVISLIADNKEKADIVAALNRSVVTRVLSMIERLGRKHAYMMTGGVAKNRGVVKTMEEKLGEKVIIPEEPQIIGAVGACLVALSRKEA